LQKTSQLSEPKILWRNPRLTPETQVAERQFLIYCSNYKKLLSLTGEEHEVLPSPLLQKTDRDRMKQRPFDYVVALADDYASALSLGSRPACVLAKVLEGHICVKIFYLDLGVGGSAASTVGDFGWAVLINSSDAPWRRNFDLAHEFFHLITWGLFTDQEIYRGAVAGESHVEQWADAFASAILLPGKEVRQEFLRRAGKKTIDYLSLVEIAREFGVSIEALLWRLVNLRLLRKTEVQRALDEGEIRDIDRKKRRADWGQEKPYLSSRYITLAIKALQMGKISKTKFAEYVGKSISEATSFLQQYGYDEDEDYSRAFATTRC
jgi:Zn-dependent peptidase ImmA (M78 family)